MKKYLLLLLLFGTVGAKCVLAQDSTWVKEYHAGEDVRLYHYDLIETYDYGYLICGYIYPYGYNAPYLGLLLKTDVNGNELWKKYIGYFPQAHPLRNSGAKKAKQTADGGYIVLGFTYQFDFSTDLYVLKLDACGEKEWSRVFRREKGQSDGDIRETSDGCYLVSLTGWEDWNHTGREWVIKLSPDGETIWMKSYGDWEGSQHWYYANTETYQMLPARNQRFVTVGETYKVELPDTTVFYERPMFVELDTAGNEIWHNVYTDNIYVGNAYKGDIDSQDNLYLGGFTAYSTVLNYPGDQPVLYKLDSAGNMVWFKVVSDTNAIVGHAGPVSVMDDTIVFTSVGYRYTTSGEDSLYVFLKKLDTSGVEIKKRVIEHIAISEPDYPVPRCSIITYNKKYLVSFQWHSPTYFELRKYNKELEYDSLYTAVFTYDSLCPHPIQNDTINLDTTIVNISEIMRTLKPVKLYPNPVKSKLRIEINIVKRTLRTLKVTTLTGATVYSKTIAPGRANATIDVAGWEPGLYMVTLYDKGIPVQTEKVVVTGR